MKTYKMKSFLAGTLFLALPFTQMNVPASAAPQPVSPAFQIAMAMSELTDVPRSHWAYQAVQYLVEELAVMDPLTQSEFKGNAFMTRYDLAEVFYNIIRKLETTNGKSLASLSDAPLENMSDVDEKHKKVVNSIVNDYGIMQAMPGHKFLGNEAISRYELAHELYTYFALVERQSGAPNMALRDRSADFTDLPADHWATKAVRGIVDKYQIMEGHPDSTFGGGKRLTRYQAAATLRDFIGYINAYLMPIVPQPTPLPTAIPTPRPTPTAMPTPLPTPIPKAPLSTFDLRLGGDFRVTNGNPTDFTNLLNNSAYGPNAELTVWFPKLGAARLGVDVYANYLFWHKPEDFMVLNRFNRLSTGGSVLWRILGADSAEDLSLVFGLGYDLTVLAGNHKNTGAAYQTMNHGPSASLGFEYPITSWLSFVANEHFTWYLGAQNYLDRYVWRNDAFIGLNIPAYTFATFELGYRDTRYIQADKPSIVLGDMGPEANLRLRF